LSKEKKKKEKEKRKKGKNIMKTLKMKRNKKFLQVYQTRFYS